MACISGVYRKIYITVEHSQFTVHYEISIFINYVSEHQLPYVVNVSHTMPISRVNRGLMLLKLISGDIVYVLGGFLHTRNYGPIIWR